MHHTIFATYTPSTFDEESPVRYFRKQFPLELAHGSTYHKAQGITLTDKHAAVMPRKSPMFFGGEYVAVSRVTDLEHLHLIRAVTADHFTSHECMLLSIQDVTIKMLSACNCNLSCVLSVF